MHETDKCCAVDIEKDKDQCQEREKGVNAKKFWKNHRATHRPNMIRWIYTGLIRFGQDETKSVTSVNKNAQLKTITKEGIRNRTEGLARPDIAHKPNKGSRCLARNRQNRKKEGHRREQKKKLPYNQGPQSIVLICF